MDAGKLSRESTQIVSRILVKALKAMLSPDFSLCLCLIPERVGFGKLSLVAALAAQLAASVVQAGTKEITTKKRKHLYIPNIMSNFSILEAAESLPPTAMAAQFVVVQYSSEIPLSLFTLSDSVRLYFSMPRVVILDADMINHRLVFLGNLVRRNASMLQRIMGIFLQLFFSPFCK
ncbi:unnamed protein product [Malus baccata var. baccata]